MSPLNKYINVATQWISKFGQFWTFLNDGLRCTHYSRPKATLQLWRQHTDSSLAPSTLWLMHYFSRHRRWGGLKRFIMPESRWATVDCGAAPCMQNVTTRDQSGACLQLGSFPASHPSPSNNAVQLFSSTLLVSPPADVYQPTHLPPSFSWREEGLPSLHSNSETVACRNSTLQT